MNETTTEAAEGGSKGEDMEPSMMVNRDMTPADVAAVTGNNNDDCWGGCGCNAAF